MNLGEVPTVLRLFRQPAPDLFCHVLRVVPLGSFLGQPVHARLRGIPVTAPIHVEVRGLVGQLPQRIAKRPRCLAWLDAAQLDLAVFQALLRRILSRRGTEVPACGPRGAPRSTARAWGSRGRSSTAAMSARRYPSR